MGINVAGYRIKLLREDKGLSQAELARGICSQSLVSRLEKGQVLLSADILNQLSIKLGTNLHDLLNKEEGPSETQITNIKEQLRKYVRRDDYKSLYRLTKGQLTNNAFLSNDLLLQFLKWHYALGLFYYRGQREKAKKELLEALLITYNGDLEGEIKHATYQELHILTSLGIFFGEVKDYKRTVSILEKVLTYYEKETYESDHFIIMKLYYNLAKALHNSFDFQSSINYCEKAIELGKETESFYLMGEIIYQYGECLHRLELNDEAIVKFHESLFIFKQLDLDYPISIINSHIKIIKKNKEIPFS